MSVGGIYYTSNNLDPKIMGVCLTQLKTVFPWEIVSVSLKPVDLGENIVLEGRKPCYTTYIEQILTALRASRADYVFFLEHDVLYHEAHFEVTPISSDKYYYNTHNYRWMYGSEIAITYGDLISLSGMSCNRQLALRHYELRRRLIDKYSPEEFESKDPIRVRKWGYEPGTKPIRKGGVSDEEHIRRRSEFPNIDIRHGKTFSPPKTRKGDFTHLPADFTEVSIDNIIGWRLKELFK